MHSPIHSDFNLAIQSLAFREFGDAFAHAQSSQQP